MRCARQTTAWQVFFKRVRCGHAQTSADNRIRRFGHRRRHRVMNSRTVVCSGIRWLLPGILVENERQHGHLPSLSACCLVCTRHIAPTPRHGRRNLRPPVWHADTAGICRTYSLISTRCCLIRCIVHFRAGPRRSPLALSLLGLCMLIVDQVKNLWSRIADIAVLSLLTVNVITIGEVFSVR